MTTAADLWCGYCRIRGGWGLVDTDGHSFSNRPGVGVARATRVCVVCGARDACVRENRPKWGYHPPNLLVREKLWPAMAGVTVPI